MSDEDYLMAELEAAQREIERLRAQLPDGMKHCSIQFKSCEKGHGWLTATNWVQHSCPTCEIASLRERIRLAAALTDTGSPEFRAAFPEHSKPAKPSNPYYVLGWRVVERIREVLTNA